MLIDKKFHVEIFDQCHSAKGMQSTKEYSTLVYMKELYILLTVNQIEQSIINFH